MTELVTTDKEAMSALKKHGDKIVWAIVLVLGSYFGWQYYQKNHAKVDTVAADSYTIIDERGEALKLGLEDPSIDEAGKAQLNKEKESLLADIDKLVATHGKTAYAWQALMTKARLQADDDNHKDAIATLKQAQAIELGDDGLMALTTLRLGQVLLADGQTDEAQTLISKALPKAFEPSRQELLGDIFIAKNDMENAKKAYQSAWDALKERQEVRSLLSLKMQAIGMTPEPISPKTPVVATPQLPPVASEVPSVQQKSDTKTDAPSNK